MNAEKARQLTSLNVVSQEDINKCLEINIISKIEKECKLGSFTLFVSQNEINQKVIENLQSLGYIVVFERKQTLMDNDNYKITW